MSPEGGVAHMVQESRIVDPQQDQIATPGVASSSNSVESSQEQETVTNPSGNVDIAKSPESYRESLTRATREAAQKLFDGAVSKIFDSGRRNPAPIETFGVLFGGTMTTVYAAATLEGAKSLMIEGGTLWQGLIEVSSLVSWIIEGGLDPANTELLMKAWTAPGVTAAFAVITGVSMLALNRARRINESVTAQDNISGSV